MGNKADKKTDRRQEPRFRDYVSERTVASKNAIPTPIISNECGGS
jgi:hypothetical protein